MMKSFFRILVMFLGILAGGESHAKNILLLSTLAGEPFPYPSFIQRLENALTAAGHTVTHFTALNSSAPADVADATAKLLTHYDVVVAASVVIPINTAYWPLIEGAATARTSDAFLLFVDSSTPGNMSPMLASLNTLAAGAFTLTAGSSVDLGGSVINVQQNTGAGVYVAPFARTAQFQVHDLQYFSGVPSANIVFDKNSPPNPNSDTVATLFLPSVSRSACLIAIPDMSLFANAAVNQPDFNGTSDADFVEQFVNALDPVNTRACALPSPVSPAVPVPISGWATTLLALLLAIVALLSRRTSPQRCR